LQVKDFIDKGLKTLLGLLQDYVNMLKLFA